MTELKLGLALLAVFVTIFSCASAQIDPWVDCMKVNIYLEVISIWIRVIMTSGSKYLQPGRDFSFTVSSNYLKKSLNANYTLLGSSEAGVNVEMRLVNKIIMSKSHHTYVFKVILQRDFCYWCDLKQFLILDKHIGSWILRAHYWRLWQRW